MSRRVITRLTVISLALSMTAAALTPPPSIRRWLFTALSALSIMLFAITALLWVRSYWVNDSFSRYRTGGECYTVESCHGAVYVSWTQDAVPLIHDSWTSTSEPSFEPWEGGWGVTESRVLPLKVFTFDPSAIVRTSAPVTCVIVSHWFLFLCFIVTPVSWLRSRLRMRRRKVLGLCPSCGYDVRATPERCPECGSVPTVRPRLI
jgi:hypothetical protein